MNVWRLQNVTRGEEAVYAVPSLPLLEVRFLRGRNHARIGDGGRGRRAG